MRKTEVPPYVAIYPVPVVLVSCIDRPAGRPNAITIAWCGITASKPPSISVSVRPSRHSHALINSEREFVINIPSCSQLKEVDICGCRSGRDSDKFDLCSFTPAESSHISAPLIKECPVNIECKVRDIVSLGSHDMFIADILSVHHDNGITASGGAIDLKRADPIVFANGEYWSLHKKIGVYGFTERH